MAKKLLVADDSLTIQKVIKLALSNDGYEIQTVSDGNDAVQQISLFRPDVILIDVSLPGQTAFEVKAMINRQGDFENTKFILMSSAFEKVDEKLVQEVKFHGRLTKPFDPTHLRQVILEVLSQDGETPAGLPPFRGPSPQQASSPPSPFPPSQLPPTLPVTETLWDQDEPTVNFADLAPPPLPGSSPAAPARSAASLELPPLPEFPDFLNTPEKEISPDSDIKHLTESTVRMSGLDDFQWSINESAKKPFPAPPGSGLPLDPPYEEASQFDLSREIEISSVSLEKPSPSEFTSAPPLSSAPQSRSAEYNPSQIEEMIQKQVQKTLEETLEKMAQKILPEVAERVIKQEIRKLLQGPS